MIGERTNHKCSGYVASIEAGDVIDIDAMEEECDSVNELEATDDWSNDDALRAAKRRGAMLREWQRTRALQAELGYLTPESGLVDYSR